MLLIKLVLTIIIDQIDQILTIVFGFYTHQTIWVRVYKLKVFFNFVVLSNKCQMKVKIYRPRVITFNF